MELRRNSIGAEPVSPIAQYHQYRGLDLEGESVPRHSTRSKLLSVEHERPSTFYRGALGQRIMTEPKPLSELVRLAKIYATKEENYSFTTRESLYYHPRSVWACNNEMLSKAVILSNGGDPEHAHFKNSFVYDRNRDKKALAEFHAIRREEEMERKLEQKSRESCIVM